MEVPDPRAPLVDVPDRADQGAVRRNNLELVLRHLAARRDSRAGIAASAGLTRATVSRLVADLAELGLVREDGQLVTGQNGRPGTALVLDGRHVLGVGVEINVDYLAVLVCDLAGTTLHEYREAFDARAAGPGPTFERLARLCADALVPAAELDRAPIVAGVTLAVAGVVDAVTGTLHEAPNLGWHSVGVVDLLTRALPLPGAVMRAGNEANLAAAAEYRFGAHAGTADMIYVTGEIGVGGGIIVGGRPLLGRRGFGGEVGHMTLDPRGPECGCGRRGCWEAYVGLGALLRTAGLVLPAGKASLEATMSVLVASAQRGDPSTLAALVDVGRWVGVGAANLANIVNPQAVIIGGYFAQVAEWLLPAASETFAAHVLGPREQVGELVVSSLGFSAAARGAAMTALNDVFLDPLVHGRPSGRTRTRT